MIAEPELASLLPAHLALQRWSGAGRRAPEGLRIESQEVIRQPWPGLVRVVVTTDRGRLQLLLGLRPAGEWGPDQVGATAAVGEVGTDRGPAFCFDATVDAELALALLALVAPEVEASAVRPVMAEQSNTSLVYDERVIFKVFRRLAGANPDVEVTTALAGRGFTHVAAPVAVWRVGDDDCGFAQRFLTGGAEGWALALTSLRDLLAADCPPEEAGGDFAPEAARLGILTAELHVALADAFGSGPGDAAAWSAAMVEAMAPVAELFDGAAEVAALMARLASVTDAGRSIRAHGDFHLGQVMRTDEGWFVLDFEGEPLRAGDERRARTSPLRDVAGMLRSMQYASLVAVNEQGSGKVELAEAWEQRNRRAFLDSYFEAVEGHGLLPADPVSLTTVLTAFELDKAVYEVGYEQAHRPDWVSIPLAGVRRLVADAP